MCNKTKFENLKYYTLKNLLETKSNILSDHVQYPHLNYFVS